MRVRERGGEDTINSYVQARGQSGGNKIKRPQDTQHHSLSLGGSLLIPPSNFSL